MTPPPAPTPETPPWDARPSGNFEAESPEPSSAPWDEQPAGETRAFPKMSFEDFDKTPPKPAAEEVPFTPPPPPPPTPEPAASASTAPPEPEASTTSSGELSEEQIDKIARRVVQLLSDQVVRNIAWEVIPDLAETVVKERIRQLESE